MLLYSYTIKETSEKPTETGKAIKAETLKLSFFWDTIYMTPPPKKKNERPPNAIQEVATCSSLVCIECGNVQDPEKYKHNNS